MSKSPKAQEATPAPEKGVVIKIMPQGEGWVGSATVDGRVIIEITNPTLYLAVAGQLRRCLDTGFTL